MATSKTKAQLEAQVKQLKDKLKEMVLVEEKQKETEKEEIGNLPDLAFSVIKEGEFYKFVELQFNRKTGTARVVNIRDAASNNQSVELAIMESQRFLSEVITTRLINGKQ